MARPKKGQGGKLQRSSIVQARLDPRLHFAAELLARKQRRTLSSLIECLLDEAIKKETVEIALPKKDHFQTATLQEALKLVWEAEEPIRFAMMAFYLPDLLTPEEQSLWAFIQSKDYFWSHYPVPVEDEKGTLLNTQWYPIYSIESLVHEHLKAYWKTMTSGPFDINAVPNEIGKKVEKPEDAPQLKYIAKVLGNSNQVDWQNVRLAYVDEKGEKHYVT